MDLIWRRKKLGSVSHVLRGAKRGNRGSDDRKKIKGKKAIGYEGRGIGYEVLKDVS